MKAYPIAEKERQARKIMAKTEYEERRNKWTQTLL
jgi:hypothetical protein